MFRSDAVNIDPARAKAIEDRVAAWCGQAAMDGVSRTDGQVRYGTVQLPYLLAEC